MRCLFILFILFVYAPSACGQGIFRYDRVDFFNELDIEEDAASKSAQNDLESIENEWAEPVIAPSGRVSIYVPPKEVREFLDKPGPENAKAYLEWNLKRIRKFIMAQKMLAKEARMLNQAQEEKDLLKANSSTSAANNTVSGGGYLFYFMLKGCPACAKEARVIENIYLNHPEIRVQAFAVGFSDEDLSKFMFPAMQDNGMSALFKIHSYPAIVLFNSKREKYFFSGYVDKERIMKLFG